jgi:hypothetical protein
MSGWLRLSSSPLVFLVVAGGGLHGTQAAPLASPDDARLLGPSAGPIFHASSFNDDCTFWYTNMYHKTTGSDWHSRSGSFSYASCPRPGAVPLSQFSARPASPDMPDSIPLLGEVLCALAVATCAAGAVRVRRLLVR